MRKTHETCPYPKRFAGDTFVTLVVDTSFATLSSLISKSVRLLRRDTYGFSRAARIASRRARFRPYRQGPFEFKALFTIVYAIFAPAIRRRVARR